MTRMQLVLARASSFTIVEESKTVANHAGDAIRRAAEVYGKTLDKLINRRFANSKKMMAKASRANIKPLNKQECETNRGDRRTL